MIEHYVTGASGFIGSHLVRQLKGKTVAIPHKKIEEFDYKPFNNFYFLSAYGNMAWHSEELMVLKANVQDLCSVIQATKSNPTRSFVYVSSSSVTLPTQTPYSRTKRAAEELLLGTKLPVCIIRPYSVIGVGEQEKHLIPTLIRSCLEGVQIQLVMDAAHDFIDVEDVCSGIITLSEARAYGVFELGHGLSYRNAAIKEMVEKTCNQKANVTEVKTMRSYDTLNWRCRNFTAFSYGWTPKKSIQQSINEMVKAYETDKTSKKVR